MNDSFDMRRYLESWPYDPEHEARIVLGDDGREVIQVRTPLGLEQLEIAGRPDGLRPHGMESALEFHLKRLAKEKAAGHEDDFALTSEDCLELFSEGTLYYFRYLRLFQLQRWADTVRDTTRNLRLFDLIKHHAEREEDQSYLEKWRAYILRMNAAAAALMALEHGDHTRALEIVKAARAVIEGLEDMEDETFRFERERSLAALVDLAAQIERHRPLSKVERLEQQLQRAIEKQEFERAAELRDRIVQIKKQAPAA